MSCYVCCRHCNSKLIDEARLIKHLPTTFINTHFPMIRGAECVEFWLVGDIFDFENAAFSIPLHQGGRLEGEDHQTATETTHIPKNFRYICCGDCEKGPLGYAILADPDEDQSKSIIVVSK